MEITLGQQNDIREKPTVLYFKLILITMFLTFSALVAIYYVVANPVRGHEDKRYQGQWVTSW